MNERDDKIKAIKGIIDRGYVRHDEILPVLKQIGMSHINPDEISDLVRRYGYGERGLGNRLMSNLKALGDKIGGYISAALGAGLLAEIMAARAFAGSLLEDKLQGFGDHLMYWLGLKSVQISGPEMMSAMIRTVEATPKVMKGMALGVVLGYIGWKVITRSIGYLLRERRKRRGIERLIERYKPSEEG